MVLSVRCERQKGRDMLSLGDLHEVGKLVKDGRIDEWIRVYT